MVLGMAAHGSREIDDRTSGRRPQFPGAGRGEAGYEGFPGETLFHFGIVIARNGIADEQDAREIGFVRVRDPDVAPLNGFTGRRRRVWLSNGEVADKAGENAERQWQVFHEE